MTILRQALTEVRAREALRVDGLPIDPTDIEIVAAIRPGDRVTIATPQGQHRTGRAVICSGTHAALDMGGRHGTPGVVTPRNVVSVKRAAH